MATLNQFSPFTLKPFFIHLGTARIAFGMQNRPARRRMSTDRKAVQRKKMAASETLFRRSVPVALSVVFNGVFRLVGYFQILNSIIQLISVFVVYNFLRKRQQLATKMLFHNQPVFWNQFPVNKAQSVSARDASRSVFAAFRSPWIARAFQPLIMFRAIVERPCRC